MSLFHTVRLAPGAVCLALIGTLYSCSSDSSQADTKQPEQPKVVMNAPPVPSEKGAAAKERATPTAETPTNDNGVVENGATLKGIGKYGFEKPETVKGIYLTAWSAGRSSKMTNILALLDRTELNSVVIDVRDSGQMYWKTGIKLADETKATMPAVAKPDQLFQRLKKHNVWPIARVAIFRDNYVPKKYKARAVQKMDGSIWKDRAGNSWLDPYNKDNWEYIAQTVEYAMDLGFPEIQLDYVRFPSEGKMSSMVFPARKVYENPKALPSEVITAFCKFMRERVKAKGGHITADIFGIISSGTTDQGIGQTLEMIAEPFDVICPMVYPSHFANGEYGVSNPNKQPYAIIKKSLADFKRRVPEAQVRPWLQDFSLFGVSYGPAEVKAQLKAMREVGYTEFLMWNPLNRYSEAGYAKAGTGADAPKPLKGMGTGSSEVSAPKMGTN